MHLNVVIACYGGIKNVVYTGCSWQLTIVLAPENSEFQRIAAE
jgi:hypothetical protein